MPTPSEAAIYAMPSDTQEQRQAQVDALIKLAQDPIDAYDGHHGTDRTEAATAAGIVPQSWEDATRAPD